MNVTPVATNFCFAVGDLEFEGPASALASI